MLFRLVLVYQKTTHQRPNDLTIWVIFVSPIDGRMARNRTWSQCLRLNYGCKELVVRTDVSRRVGTTIGMNRNETRHGGDLEKMARGLLYEWRRIRIRDRG